MEFSAPKGEPTRVVNLWASTVPDTFRFSARTITGESATGRIEVIQRRLFGSAATEIPLQGQNSIRKSSACLSYRIFVTPDEDTTIYFETTHVGRRSLVWVLGILAGLAAAAALAPYVMQFINAL